LALAARKRFPAIFCFKYRNDCFQAKSGRAGRRIAMSANKPKRTFETLPPMSGYDAASAAAHLEIGFSA
jgi:hypothetical protein